MTNEARVSTETALKMAIEQLWHCAMLMNSDHSDYLYEDTIKVHDICKEALEQLAPSWQGLSDDEVDDIWFEVVKENNFEGTGKYFWRAIEQALKEKNG